MMMRRTLCAALLALTGSAPAFADCSLSSDPHVVIRPVSMNDANLIASMSIMPKLLHIDYAQAVASDGCDMGHFSVGDVSYTLYGADQKGRSRRAIPAKTGEVAAIIVPVVDLLAATAAAKQGQSATVEGYMLATIGKDDLIGWQLYSGIPNGTTLLHDMAAVLNGQGKPIFENRGGQTSLFVPK